MIDKVISKNGENDWGIKLQTQFIEGLNDEYPSPER